MNATVKQTNKKTRFDDCQVAPGMRAEIYLTPEVKIANEIICDHCMGQAASVTCSKWYIRKAPFVLGTQSLT
jgi:hypothetical protein